MSVRRLFALVVLAAILGGFVGVTVFQWTGGGADTITYKSVSERQKTILSSYDEVRVPKGLNFVYAADVVTPAVVHIQGYSGNDFSYFHRGRYNSSGSGVILTDDGYIVTNKHVVDNASRIRVKLNDNQEYEARLVGSDANTDIALLKVKGEDLPFLPYGNSDDLKLGEWVLAIGNPFELYSTVTAGIVSAKGRNMGILAGSNSGLEIESFIQTDAAVNPGNSGGALVNLDGQLIGINTAIATMSGRYEGYSFAVPSTLVRKVVDDLIEFGEVRRGLLGVRIGDVNANIALERELNVLTGVFVSEVYNESAAEEAGLLPGDVILGINEREITKVSELQEIVARYRPGDVIRVRITRDNIEQEFDVRLKGSLGNTGSAGLALLPEEPNAEDAAVYENLSASELDEFGINGGVRILDANAPKWRESGIEEGFIITHIDNERIDDMEDLERTLEDRVGEEVMVIGISPDGDRTYYNMDW